MVVCGVAPKPGEVAHTLPNNKAHNHRVGAEHSMAHVRAANAFISVCVRLYCC